MVAAGYLAEDEANRWRARRVVVRQRPDFFRTTSPYFAEHVRRDIAPPLRREEAARGRARDRDRGRAVDRRCRRRRTSTSRCASWTSGRGGADRSRGWRARRRTNSARASPRATAPIRPSRGGCTSGWSRARGPGGARACASARGSTRCRRGDAVGGAVQHPRQHQRQAAGARRSACCARATSSG